MTKINLESLDVEALLTLRGQVEATLESRRDQLQTQLASLGMGATARRTSTMKGRKVAPKYRGPDGETWAGRGAKPRWLVAATARGTGKKLDDFLIEKKRKSAA